MKNHVLARARRETRRRALLQSQWQNFFGARIFFSQVNTTFVGIDCITGQQHSLDQRMWIVLDEKTINVCAGIAFVGVRNDKLLSRVLLRDRAPFLAGWKSGAAASAQARDFDSIDKLVARSSQDFFKSVVSAVRTQSACSAANEPPQRNSFARMNFHARSRFAILYRGRDEAIPETINSWILNHRLGPALWIQMTRSETSRAPACLSGKTATGKMIERINLPPSGCASCRRDR